MFDLLLIELFTDQALSNSKQREENGGTHAISGLSARCRRVQAAVVELVCCPAISKAIIICATS